MARLTLHRAGRVQEQISSRIGRIVFEPHARISVFSTDPEAEVEQRVRDLRDNVARLQRLETVRTGIRSAVARQNAETGVSALLAEKTSLEREISILSTLVDERSLEVDEWLATRRRTRRRAPHAKRGRVALRAQIEATRARFEAGEGEVHTDILVPLLDDALEQEVRDWILDRQRRLDEVSDKLRTLNSSATIDLADDALNYLRQEGVL